jgi:glucose-1-phosphate adenylyltransferase
VHRSLISHGCVIYGTVEHSVLSPGVRVDPGAVVRDSIVMGDTVIRAGAIIDRAIIDKDCSIGPNAVVGGGTDPTPNRDEPTRLNTGITVVGKRAVVPRGVRLGRNVKVNPGTRAVDYRGRVVKSGSTIAARRESDEPGVPRQPARRPAPAGDESIAAAS